MAVEKWLLMKVCAKGRGTTRDPRPALSPTLALRQSRAQSQDERSIAI
jgi:hypothetical protein